MRLTIHASLLLLVGLIIGWVSIKFAGASAGAFDTAQINTGDTAWVLVATALLVGKRRDGQTGVSPNKFHLRVGIKEEKQGLDIAVHGEPGYRL